MLKPKNCKLCKIIQYKHLADAYPLKFSGFVDSSMGYQCFFYFGEIHFKRVPNLCGLTLNGAFLHTFNCKTDMLDHRKFGSAYIRV